MLQGRMTYRHGNETYEMGPGDTLTFRGDVPHGPEVLSETPTLFLAVIIYGRGRE
jgi:quercetin dioxygenase-like cupin family protein